MTGSHPILTLTTDFGTKDGFAATMKGVIWSICPAAHIADISHEISPQKILEGAYALWRACSFFPAGTIHVAVVDPGVGTSRRPIAAQLGSQFFVGPDNGLFTPMVEESEKKGGKLEIVQLTNGKYFLAEVSHTFHGRDLFAPVAAHIANGTPLTSLGPVITDPVRLPLPKPEKTAHGWHAHITVIDHFGNCTTDLPASWLLEPGTTTFQIRQHKILGLVGSYGHKSSGELVALEDSEGFIEIALVNGNAAALLHAVAGDLVEVILQE